MTSPSTELMARARAVLDRIDALASISDDTDALTRLFLSPAHIKANRTLLGWIEQAGLDGFADPVGNVICELSGTTNSRPPLMLGSHIDTVRDAGKYDGTLGVLVALNCLEHLKARGVPPSVPIRLIAFGDEEGVRFGSTILGSRAVAGLTTADDLARADPDGITVYDALIEACFEPEDFAAASMTDSPPAAYVELHIEQGPVLDTAGESLACVSAIVGSRRMLVEINGLSGHAGTVPMSERQDALAAAAECICLIEDACRRPDMVGTVGFLETHPNAGNVIAGRVRFSLDIRSHDDALLKSVCDGIEEKIAEICARRHVDVTFETTGGAHATRCDDRLIQMIEKSIPGNADQVRRLPSGAGHDGIAMSNLCPIGMIFVRCAKGISHHPAEAVDVHDIAAAIGAMDRFIELYEREQTLPSSEGS
ncbi:M20 family metallo-hydrolase [uncultured Martelella sp.]|uniref:M20 family metallo-hydrolase n=1 Tax=uncultured Martelella sp. TaxID=392331 RepID=UPI0029C7358A|nr:M20 family metallo-hydrolase [uncultured Martelella sp.]